MSEIPVTHSKYNLSIIFSGEDVFDYLFSDKLALIFQWLIFSCVCQAVSLFGIGTNIVNIICFVKQGFKEPVNVSFLALAVSDIGCLVTITFSNLCFTPTFLAADLPFVPIEFQYLVSAMPHATFTRITSFITVLITLERCLCITAPIKIKTIVTPKRVTIIIVVTVLVLMVSTAPVYFVNMLGDKFYPDRNKTLIGLVFMGDKNGVEKVFFLINNACIPFGTFMMTIICTIMLVLTLHKKSIWRAKTIISSQADNVSIRNQNVAKMVVMISTLFIFCFIPVCIYCIAMIAEPELSVYGKYRNALSVFGGFCVLLEAINSSSNIFFYYRMSSKYRVTLRHVFCLDSKI